MAFAEATREHSSGDWLGFLLERRKDAPKGTKESDLHKKEAACLELVRFGCRLRCDVNRLLPPQPFFSPAHNRPCLRDWLELGFQLERRKDAPMGTKESDLHEKEAAYY